MPPKPETLDETLAERGGRYGSFFGNAVISQSLKKVMHDSPNWPSLSADMQEALEMMALKMSRVLSGAEPAYVDNWRDMSGYAELVVERLAG